MLSGKISGHALRSMLQDKFSGNVRAFETGMRTMLGLGVDHSGLPTFSGKPEVAPDQFGLRNLAEGLIGQDWPKVLESALSRNRPSNMVLEAGEAAITPGQLSNVSAYLGTVTGLLDAQLMLGYKNPKFIIPNLIPTTSIDGIRQLRMLGLSSFGDAAGTRKPGDPHPRAQFTERYSLSPETQNTALACEVTFEAVHYDRTGEVLQQANKVGEAIALRQELEGWRTIVGYYNTYNYGGVAYNTYGTSGNWINDMDQPLEDWTDINQIDALFSRMTEQETGMRVVVDWDTQIVSPTRLATADQIKQATGINTRTNYSSGNLEERQGPNYLKGRSYDIVSSNYLDMILTDTAAKGGMALSQAQANEWNFALNTSKTESAFVRAENWPFKTVAASPTDYNLLDRKIVLAVFADKQDVFAVRDPRYVVRCTHTGYH